MLVNKDSQILFESQTPSQKTKGRDPSQMTEQAAMVFNPITLTETNIVHENPYLSW